MDTSDIPKWSSQQGGSERLMVLDDRRRPFKLAAALFGVAVVAIVVALPSVPAAWASLSHFSQIGDNGSGELGFVTVSSCQRGDLLVDWTCRGTFQVNDPMAESYPPTADVAVRNDSSHYRRGAQVSSTLGLHSKEAYLYGGTEQYKVLAVWLGFALCVFSAGLALLRLSRSWIALPILNMVVGVFLLAATGSLF